MAERRKLGVKDILADPERTRALMVPTIQATQSREGIATSREQAERAYYVVTEAEHATFFDLERHRGEKRGEADRREEMFVRALRDGVERVRFDVARRDFAVIDLSPLAFRRVGLVGHIFRDNLGLEAGKHARVRQGAGTANDGRYVRMWWEARTGLGDARYTWERFAKGGGFSRFYRDVHLLVHWDPRRQTLVDYFGRKGRPTESPVSGDDYFKPGLTWPRRTQRGFSVRVMPEGCVFADKGPAIFPSQAANRWLLLGLCNSALAEYLLRGLMSFGSWEVGVIKRLPIPKPDSAQHRRISELAQAIHDAKRDWDTGNEISTAFDTPWLLRESLSTLDLPTRLDRLAAFEAEEEASIQALYAELNDEVYALYDIDDATRAIIEETMGERPPEILWPEMEKKTTEQKRMDHVWRLLSHLVRRVVDADEDGIVPFIAVGGERPLAERVRAELAAAFPGQDASAVEVALTNELKRKVKGYRRVNGLDQWLADVFFDYHVKLYKKRPILWHVTSAQGRGACAFGAIAHYHKLDADRLAKLRGTYLRDALAHFRREAALAGQEGRAEDRQELQAKVEEAEALDRRLRWIQEGVAGHPAPGDCRIRTPWKADDELPVGWRPDLDDGVAVNIRPFQTAGALRVAKVV